MNSATTDDYLAITPDGSALYTGTVPAGREWRRVVPARGSQLLHLREQRVQGVRDRATAAAFQAHTKREPSFQPKPAGLAEQIDPPDRQQPQPRTHRRADAAQTTRSIRSVPPGTIPASCTMKPSSSTRQPGLSIGTSATGSLLAECRSQIWTNALAPQWRPGHRQVCRQRRPRGRGLRWVRWRAVSG